jgi:hypothetical protein
VAGISVMAGISVSGWDFGKWLGDEYLNLFFSLNYKESKKKVNNNEFN